MKDENIRSKIVLSMKIDSGLFFLKKGLLKKSLRI
jgi:hypothetical protein